MPHRLPKVGGQHQSGDQSKPNNGPRKRRRVTRSRSAGDRFGVWEPLSDLPKQRSQVPEWLHRKWDVPLNKEGWPAAIGLDTAIKIAGRHNMDRHFAQEEVALRRIRDPEELQRRWCEIEARRLRAKYRMDVGMLRGGLPRWLENERELAFVQALKDYPDVISHQEIRLPEIRNEREPTFVVPGIRLPPRLEIRLPLHAIAAVAWMAGVMRRPTESGLRRLRRRLNSAR